MMSVAGTPAFRNGMWSSSIGVLASTNTEPWPNFRAVDQMMSVSQGVELLSRMKRGERSAIMSTSTSAFSVDRRSGLARGVDVVLAAVGVIGSRPSPVSVASSPSKKISSIVNAFVRAFSTRAISIRNAVLDPPSFAPTNRNSRNSLVS